jgi:hypothetical protein
LFSVDTVLSYSPPLRSFFDTFFSQGAWVFNALYWIPLIIRVAAGLYRVARGLIFLAPVRSRLTREEPRDD